MSVVAPFREIAAELNHSCFCMSLDRDRLISSLEAAAPVGMDWTHLANTHPHLFAANPAFVSKADLEVMLAVAQAIERVAGLEAYRNRAMLEAPELAWPDRGTKGLFMGYDFHLTPDGPRLIEINTNAGGAFLNAQLRMAQQACCNEVSEFHGLGTGSDFPLKAVESFKAEWNRQVPGRELKSVAIVDEDPQNQYLYPEFLLARAMLEQAGLVAVICDPRELVYDGAMLKHGDTVIDLVYNRLVDFQLEAPGNRALREAYAASATVISPGPHHHALLANKRNLVWLSDAQTLRDFGVQADDMELLKAIPETVLVSQANAEELWSNRKHLFFKPLAGHGGKAVYRGDKLTRTAWSDILQHDYIAQRLILPGERWIRNGDGTFAQKMDVRLYTYDGQLLMTAARVYQGQTTNFRTPGGGFAPVLTI